MAKTSKANEQKWNRKSKTKAEFILPEEFLDLIESQALTMNMEPQDYIKRLVTIDILEDRLAVLKYKRMIDRF